MFSNPTFQENFEFLAQHCLPEEETDDEGEDQAQAPLKQAFHKNLTELGT
jgi:hypothetical protein